jgi:hypothetical protein
MTSGLAFQEIGFDDSSLDSIIGDYFDGLERETPGLGELMRLRAQDDETFLQDCKRAACDALLLSTLATTIGDDGEFRALVEATWDFEEEFFEQMRADLLDISLTTARGAIRSDEVLWRGINKRIRIFCEAKGLPPPTSVQEGRDRAAA